MEFCNGRPFDHRRECRGRFRCEHRSQQECGRERHGGAARLSGSRDLHLEARGLQQCHRGGSHADGHRAPCRRVGPASRGTDRGPITIGATLTAGVAYYCSGTAGGIAPVADVTTGWYVTIVGIATSTTVLDVKFHASGVAL